MIRFGIIGLGKIANKFASDIARVAGAELHAVASRDGFKAQQFADTHFAKRHYDSYKKLVNDPKVDVVYIATPNAMHYTHALLCLKAGKAVICEKPFAINAWQAGNMIACAKEHQVFLMEAMWTRFMPATAKVLELIQDGVIGKVKRITADFGFAALIDPEKRLFNNKLGGGSLLDIGIYPLYLATLILGYPKRLMASANMHYTQVDTDCRIQLEYANGAEAILDSSFLETTPTEAIIQGDKGAIYMHPRFHHCKKITVTQANAPNLEFDLPYIGLGYAHEIKEVVHCLEQGAIESPLVSHKHSLEFMELLDEVRNRIGLVFPEDCP